MSKKQASNQFLNTENQSKERVVLTKDKLRHLEPNLIESHLRSYEIFIEEGVQEVFNEITPIEDYTGESWELKFEKIKWGDININFNKAQRLGLSYDRPMYADTKLINKKTGEIKKQEIFIADIPVMSPRATFVINGNERVVVMQIVRSEGVLFTESRSTTNKGEKLYLVKLMPERGRWFDFEINKKDIMSIKLLDKKPRILLTTLLRALGYSSDNELRNVLKDAEKEGDNYINTTLKKDKTKNTEEALLEIYRKLRPEDTINLESAREFLDGIFFNKRRFYLGRVGRYQLNRKLGRDVELKTGNYLLQKEDLVGIVRSLIMINNGKKRPDDIDSLENRRIRGVGELIGERFRVGVLRMEKNIKDRMSTHSTDDKVTPGMLINTRPVIASINQFFGSSSVSRYMDQENILSELETKRRITAGGPRGLTKERATFSVRDVHSTHYSRVCMVTTPEGPSIGIVSHMSIYAKINDYGFLEAPYYKIATKIQKKDLKDKDFENAILSVNLKNQKGKKIANKGDVLDDKLIKKLQKQDFDEIDIVPKLTSQVDYLVADEELEYRIGPALVELDKHGNVVEDRVFVRHMGSFININASELDYIDVNPAQIGGIGFSLIPFAYNDDPVRTLMGANMQRQAVPLVKPEAPIVGTGYERIVAKSSGRLIEAEDDGEVVVSDAQKLIVKYKNTKKETEYHIDKYLRTNQNTCFSQRVLVGKGEKFKKGDILADGPSMDKGELALGRNLVAAYMHYEGYNYEDAMIVSDKLVKEDILTSVHIHEYVQDVRETKLGNEQITRDIPNVGDYALRNLDNEGIVRIGAYVKAKDILVGIIAPKGETELTAEEKLLRAIFGEYARDVRDNSLRLPHGDHGIVIGVQVLDKEKGDKLNPGVLKQVKVWVARTGKISVGDKLTGLHGDKGVIAAILPEAEMPFLEDGTPVDIILQPFSMVKRMNLGQLHETVTAAKADKLDINVAVPPFTPISEEILDNMLKKHNIDFQEKVKVFDGRTGEPFPEDILVGKRHIIKLNHLSSDKIHARSTGPYTMVTQQPLGGKAQMGGQRFGEMEVWALQSYAVPHVLHEMLTIKSDDVIGRAAAYKSIIQGTPIAPPNIPESFKVLVSELRALMLNLEPIEPEEDEKDLTEIIEGNLDEEEQIEASQQKDNTKNDVIDEAEENTDEIKSQHSDKSEKQEKESKEEKNNKK